MMKVSFVIPLYNGSGYIERALESIGEQRHKNIEIIVVDDGSTDNGFDKTVLMQKKYNNIIAIPKEHTGPADTRNKGLEQATGEYIGFLDCDDYFEPDFTSTLVQCLEESGAQIASCETRDFNGKETSNPDKEKNPSIMVYPPEEYLKLVYSNHKVNVVMWNKIYARELFKEINFPNNELYEDVPVNYLLCSKATRIVHIKKVLHNYNTGNSSITRSQLCYDDFQQIQQWNKVIKWSYNQYPGLREIIFARKIAAYRAMVRKFLIHGTVSADVVQQLILMLRKEMSGIIRCTAIPPNKKVLSLSAAISPRCFNYTSRFIK